MDPTPTTDVKQVMEDAPVALAAFFSSLVAEPTTGVGVISEEGQVIYLNEQAARIFHGPDAKPEQWVGTFWHQTMPPEWTEERLKVLRAMLVHGKPVLMRTIWRGFQHFTWITHIPKEQPADGEPTPDRPPAELFLTITRRAATDEEAEQLMPRGGYEEVESGVMKLGALDVLSDRELEVLALIGQGLSIKEAAKVLYRSEKTIDNHRMSIHTKLKVHDRVALSEIVRRAGLGLADVEKARL